MRGRDDQQLPSDIRRAARQLVPAADKRQQLDSGA